MNISQDAPHSLLSLQQPSQVRSALKTARSIGASHIATGHYAVMIRSHRSRGSSSARRHGQDQTYFLSASPKTSSPIPLSLGHLTSPRPRSSPRARLALAKPDSQEICFILAETTAVPYAYPRNKPRYARDSGNGRSTGEILGRHEASPLHRWPAQGLGVASPSPSTSSDRPRSHRVTVGADADWRPTPRAAAHWIAFPSCSPMRVKIKIRHRHELPGPLSPREPAKSLPLRRTSALSLRQSACSITR